MAELNLENDLKFLVKNDSWSTTKLILGQKWPNLALKMNLAYLNQIMILKKFWNWYFCQMIKFFVKNEILVFGQKWPNLILKLTWMENSHSKNSETSHFLSWECEP